MPTFEPVAANGYDGLISREAERTGVPPSLLRALVLQESSNNPGAVNAETGAAGLAQLMPSTAKALGVTDPHDPEQAIRAAADYLRTGYDTTGNTRDALRHYYAGPNRSGWGARTNRYPDDVLKRIPAEERNGGFAWAEKGAKATFTPVEDTPKRASAPTFTPIEPAEEATLTTSLERGLGQAIQGAHAVALGTNQRLLDTMNRVDKGENVREIDDPMGYLQMDAQQRAATRADVEGLLSKNISGVVTHGQTVANIPQHPATAELQKAKTFDEVWRAFKKDPVGIVYHITAESAPAMAPGLIAAAVVPGGAPAKAAAMGAGSYASEYASDLVSYLQDAGVDITNPDAIKKAASDSALMERISKQAHTKATIVGGLDAVSGAVAGKSLAPARLATKPIASEAANIATQAPVQGALGAAGEAAGSVAAGKTPEAGDVAGEFLGEFAGTPAEIAVMAATRGKVRPHVRPQTATQQAIATALAASPQDAPATASEPSSPTATFTSIEPQPAEAMAPQAPTETAPNVGAPAAAVIPAEAPPSIAAPESIDPVVAARAAIEEQHAANAVATANDRSAAVRKAVAISNETGERHVARMVGDSWVVVPAEIAKTESEVPSARTVESQSASAAEAQTAPQAQVDVGRVAAEPAAVAAEGEARSAIHDEGQSPSETVHPEVMHEDFRTRRDGTLKVFASEENAARYASQRSNNVPGNMAPRETPGGWVLSRILQDSKPEDIYQTPAGMEDYATARGEVKTFATADKAARYMASNRMPRNYQPRQLQRGEWALSRRKLERSAAQKANDAALRAKARNVRPEDDVLAVLDKSGGILMSEVDGADPKDMASANQSGFGTPFRKTKGLTLDGAAEALAQHGFDVHDEAGRVDATKAREIIDRALHGEKVYSPEGHEIHAGRQPAPERRQDAARRKAVADMTHDELRAALLTDDLTGLGNRRAYEEAPKKPVQASVDVDSLKWINDNLGHAAGDDLLRAVGEAMKDEGIEAYHVSGDEFVAQFEHEAAGVDAMNRVRDRLDRALVTAIAVDGTRISKKGVGFSYGLGQDTHEADAGLQRDKSEREWAGQRAARGQEPEGVGRVAPVQADAARSETPSESRADQEVRRAAFSRDDRAPARGLSVDDVRSILEPIVLAWKNAPDLKVLGSFDEAPRAIRGDNKDQLARGAHGRPYAFFHEGSVYLIADEVTSAQEAITGFFHETLGHHGLRATFGPALNDILAQIVTARSVEVAAMARKYGMDTLTREERLAAAEEVLAEMAQTRPEIGYVRRAIASIRNWLRAHGVDLHWSDDDILQAFVLPARAWVERGRPVGAPSRAAFQRGERPQLDLTGETEAQIKQREALEKKAADEKRAKDNAPPAADFTLTGSDRPADVAEAAGQKALFARKVMPKWLESATAQTQEAAKKAGLWHEEKTLKERIAGIKENAAKRITQGLFDQYAPLKELDYKAYVLARMTKAADAGLEATLFYGTPILDQDGAVRINLEKGGLIGVLQKLGGEHDRFLAWVAGNRAAQLKAEGRENLFTDTDISALKSLADGRMNDGRARTVAYSDALRDFNRYGRAILDISEKAGIINGAERKTWERDFYVPFYRILDDEEVKGPRNLAGLTNQHAFKKLKGGTDALNDLLANTLQNWSHLLSASLKNQAATASLRAAEKVGAAEEISEAQKGSVFILEAGKKRHFEVSDPFVLDAISAMDFSGFKNPVMKFASAAKHALTLGVTISPTFRLRNLIRDQLQAVGTNPISYNVMKNVVEGVKYSSKDNPEYAQMLAGGAIMRLGTVLEGDRAKYAKRLIESGIQDAEILDTAEKTKNAVGAMWNWWQEVGERSESITRATIYKQLTEQGKSHLEAAFTARDSMDFSLQGSWPAVRMLTQSVPFMNARLQGLYKLGRAYKEDTLRFGIVLGGTAAATIGLMLAYRDDPEWKKRAEWDRDNFWWFRVGDKAFRIPKPFEIGAIASIAERGLEAMLDGMDKEARKRFLKRLGAIISDNLAMNPIPQLVKPIGEAWANYDTFRSKPIETQAMGKLSPSERVGPSTSATAQMMGKASGMSPVMIDYLIQGYFGWLGTHVAMAADLALRPMTSAGPAPTRKIDDYFVVGDWVKSLPSNQSRYVDQFYNQSKQVQQAFSDMRHYQQLGQIDKAKAILAESKDDIRLHPMYDQAQRSIGQINQRIRYVEMTTKMDPDQKREELDRLNQLRNSIAERVETKRAGLRSDRAPASQR